MKRDHGWGGFAIRFLVTFSGIFLICDHAPAAQTYYVSKSVGSDQNTATQATSKSTPWAHLPGMPSCSSNCKNYTPSPGDTFILMGCDTWVSSDLPVSWDWSGSSGNPITVTVDHTWYNTTACPSAWNRPIFDGQLTATGPFLNLSINATRSYIVFDNIEMKRGTGNSLRYISCYEQCGYTTVQNMYLHAWNVTTDGNCVILAFYGVGNVAQQNIIDGSDASGASPPGATCYAAYAGLPNMENNVIHDLANGVVGYAAGNPAPSSVDIGGNLIYNIRESNGGSHPNAIEIVGGGVTYYIHDNVIHDLQASGAETLMFGNSGETDYIWNNVFYNNSVANAPEAPQTSGQTGISFTAWNNTIATGNGASCFHNSGQSGAGFTAVTIQNNHCISTASTAADSTWAGTAATLTTNVLQTPTVASGQGYTSSETYAYSPASANGSTVGVGTNLNGNCSGSLAGLCNVTQYACTYNSTSETVTCPANSTTGRPPLGAWNVGSYQYPTSGLPQAPTNLVAVGH